ncbi:hypothetical protein HDU84_001191, partial [Entophlyctis sp. JEL0112]
MRLNEILKTPLSSNASQILTDLPTHPPLTPSPLSAASHAASAPAIPAWTPHATLLTYLEEGLSLFGQTKPVNIPKIRKLNGQGSVLPQMRLVKSEAEIAVLRHAGKISGRAVADAMRATKHGVSEHYLHSLV